MKVETFENLKRKVLDYHEKGLSIGETKKLLEEINLSFKALRPIMNKLNEKYPNQFTGENYVKYAREFEEFYDLIVEDIELNDNYYNKTDVRGYLINFFNQYANFLENQKYEIELIPIETYLPEILTLDRIRDTLSDCDLLIAKEEYGAAITSAKTLLEGTFKEIILSKDPNALEKHIDFPALKKQAFEILNMSTKNKSYDNDLIKLIGNLSTIADTVNSIRNKVGIGHIGVAKPNQHHALLVVNAAKTVMTFVFHSYDFQSRKAVNFSD